MELASEFPHRPQQAQGCQMENRTPQLRLYSEKQGLIVREDTLSQIDLTKYHFRTPAGTELGSSLLPRTGWGKCGCGHTGTPAYPSKPSTSVNPYLEV